MNNIISTGAEYGLIGFLIALLFLQPIIFLKIFWEMAKRMLDTTERSIKSSTELTAYMKGRNGRT